MAGYPEFLREIWALFTIGTLWISLRFLVRIRTVGIRGLQGDDAFALTALISWIVIVAGIHITYYTGAAVAFTALEAEQLSTTQLRDAIYGSKVYFLTWYAYITMIFSLKGIVIVFYRRLAFNKWQRTLLKCTAAYCIAGFVAITLFLSFGCWPYSHNWQVRPMPDKECTAKPKAFITMSCLNASSDALLLAIPIPMLWNLQFPPMKRLGIVILLSSGIFVMAACITRVSLTVVPNVTLSTIARWGARELCIGCVAVNSAMLTPLFRRSFWCSNQQRTKRNQRNHNNFSPPFQRVLPGLTRKDLGVLPSASSYSPSTQRSTARQDSVVPPLAEFSIEPKRDRAQSSYAIEDVEKGERRLRPATIG